MADFTFLTLTTGIDAFDELRTTATNADVGKSNISRTNGTVSRNLSFNDSLMGYLPNEVRQSHLTGRRPHKGLQFPRGVYNK